MYKTDELVRYRKEIDDLDKNIILLIANRIDICREVALYKKKENIPMMQVERVNQVLERCIKMGMEFNLDSKFVKSIFQEIIHEACRIEDGLIQKVDCK